MARPPFRTAVIAVALLGVFAAAFAFGGDASKPVIGSYAEETEYWQHEIALVGGKSAHDEMVERYSTMNTFDAHEYAHVFGAALYAIEGVQGFSACGNEYVWGCAHSLTERAIAEQGLAAVATLNATCLKLPREDIQECQHGLGHGILSHLGVEHLDRALDECRAIGGTYGCASGVFMEYLNGNIHDGRPPVVYNEAGKYGPCDSVPEQEKLICYRRLPNWWALTFRGSDDERVRFIEKNCLDISRQGERDACFVGLGYNETSDADFDPQRGTQVCETLQEQRNTQFCMYGGVLAMFQNTPVRDRAVRMCPSGDLAQCVTAAERLLGASEEGLALPD